MLGSQDRLGYSAKPELLPLVRLSRDLPPFRARALWEAGYPSPLQLAAADAAHVTDVLLRCVPFRSAGWEESAVSERGFGESYRNFVGIFLGEFSERRCSGKLEWTINHFIEVGSREEISVDYQPFYRSWVARGARLPGLLCC